MKKLVAISVLFAGLAMAVSAQWSNEWKVSFLAKYITDMYYAEKATGENVVTNTGDPTQTTEWGNYAKGVSHFFPNQRKLGASTMGSEANIGGDFRLMVTFQNEGENYAVKTNIAVDNDWIPAFDGRGAYDGDRRSLGWYLTQGNMLDDWGIKGNAGIFSVGLGPWAVEASWVGTQAIWGSWIGWSELNRFGVWRQNGGWVHSNHFRTMNKWGTPFAVGIGLGDNYKFTLGYRLDPAYTWWEPTVGDGNDSRSSINGTFMLSGRPVEMLTFDLFYTVNGVDDDTYARPLSGNPGYTPPVASWKNMIGAYVGINGIENLSASVGYTVNFNAFEAGSYVDPTVYANTPATSRYTIKGSAVTYNAPVYSGIDLRLGYSGIDKIGLKFLTNVSFAGVKGQKADTATSNSSVNLLFSENRTNINTEGESQDWFGWKAILQANLGFIDGVGLEVSLGNSLGVLTNKSDKTNAGLTTKINNVDTTNEFRVTVGAKYGVLGVALFLQVDSRLKDYTTETSGTTNGKRTEVGNDTIVKFGIPIYFQVSF